MLCVTMMIVVSFFSFFNKDSIFAVAMGSRAEHGSSSKITSGLIANALAMQRRCCWPPERLKFDIPTAVSCKVLEPPGNKEDFEGRKEILKSILSELNRSIKHISGRSSKMFVRINNEDSKRIYEQIHEIRDYRFRKYLEDMARYTLDIEDELINISFYNKMRPKLDRGELHL